MTTGREKIETPAMMGLKLMPKRAWMHTMKDTIKNILMCVVLAGAIVFSYIAFRDGETLNGLGFILTACIPILIWFSDGRDNKKRDGKFQKLKNEVESHGLKLVENPEWIWVVVDAEDKILFGIKHDGSIDWSVGVPTPIREEFEAQKKRIAELEKNICSL